MSTNEAIVRRHLSGDLTEALIRVGMIFFLAVMCVRVFAPFANLVIWGLILAVALEPLHGWLAARMGGRQGLAATVLVLTGLLLIGVPTVMLGSSFAAHLQDVYATVHDGTLSIPPPAPAVADWPIVGERIFSTWDSAATNLPGLISENQVQLKVSCSRST